MPHPALRSEAVTPQQALAIARWMGYTERNAYLDDGAFAWKGDPGMPGDTEPLRSDVDYGHWKPLLKRSVELDFGSGRCQVVAFKSNHEFWAVFDAIVAASSVTQPREPDV